MSGTTYDAGALLAAETGEGRLLALHQRALARGVVPTVPTAVHGPGLARWSTAASCPSAHRLCGRDVRRGPGYAADGLCGLAGTADVVDACVVIGALERGDAVVTSDRGDLQTLASAAGSRLNLHDV